MSRLCVFSVGLIGAFIGGQNCSAQDLVRSGAQVEQASAEAVFGLVSAADSFDELDALPATSPSFFEIQGETVYGDGSCQQCFDGCLDGSCSRTWVRMTPYLWATMMKGNVTVLGQTAPVNIDLSDLWDLLENGDVRGGFMGHLEFGRDNWTIFLNGDLVSLAPTVSGPRGTINAGATINILETGIAFDVFSTSEIGSLDSPLRVQLLGGIRYYGLDTEIVTIPVNPILPGLRASEFEDWVDLFAGVCLIAQVNETTSFVIRGDWGGYGIGTSSNKAWNLVALVSMQLKPGCNLLVGYRILDIDQAKRTGTRLAFGFDAKMHGPLTGLMFQF
jgi:hypothetical protein